MVNRGLCGGKFHLITSDDARRIHGATIEVLESTGMHCPSEKIMKVFKDGGADVDEDKKRIRIPQHLVTEALKKIPHQIVFCGRDSANDILLEARRVYYGMGGTPVPFIRDLDSGEIRRPTKKDMEESTILGDALPNMKFLMNIAGAFDVPYQAEYLHEFEVLFNNTTKPILYSAPGEYASRKVLEMASTIVGGKEMLAKKPILTLYAETSSPLAFSAVNENILEFARYGVPFVNGATPMCGGSAPMSLAGAIVIGNAENLATLTLAQLVRPHSPVIYSGWACVMDPVTSRFSYGAPEFAMGTNSLNAAMASYYDLPCYGFGGCTDAKTPDAQAGAEVMMNCLVAGLSGVNLIHDCGYLAGGSVGSMEMAVVDNEIIGYVERILRGVRVDDETLATDLIKAVGPQGHFMSHKHTLDNIRKELYIPKLFDRTSEATWMKQGKKSIQHLARDQARQILREHTPKPLDKEIKQKIGEIVKNAEKELAQSA
jgi:trimethylamine--corrinoid protein Co-methyltransferase